MHYPLPSWVYESVVYQIFPDRFAIGNGKNVYDKAHLYTKRGGKVVDWNTLPKHKPNIEHCFEFWGGDLWGIAEKLDYINDLGANLIYTTPIFLSPSNHKYDTADYMKIDPQFGGQRAFIHYLKRAKEHGFKVMLDGVFNHLSKENKWFQNALKGKRKHLAKFSIYEDGYRAWHNVPDMPEWNWEETSVREYLLNVVEYYLRLGTDGWRLDVGFDVGYVNNAIITSRAKSVSIEKYVVTETWNFPSNWEVVDGIMNYHFRESVIGWLKGDLKNLGSVLQDAYNSTPNIYGCWNMLDSHDTQRIATVLPDKSLRKLAIVIQFTYPGVPFVYYGSEIGIEGGWDPENRAPMIWDESKWDNELRDFYKKIISIRKKEIALKVGQFKVLSEEPLAFLRKTPYVLDDIIVIVNKGKKTECTLSVPDGRLLAGTCFVDLFTNEEFYIVGGVLRTNVPEKGFRILKAVNKIRGSYNQYKRIY
ncbi:MAG: cyclomaltodextrinase [Fervidobacterium sp.]|nr:cyclomaltodextrinase [Fervidobacterium sp.]